jgi:hypothetical protein
MEHTYTIRAADGQEYGPATLNELTGWIREGRVSTETELRRSDMEHWAGAGSFVELQSILSPTPTPTPAPPAVFAPSPSTAPAAAFNDPQSFAQLKSGASWFYWIAALSLINSIVAITGNNWRFIFGLGITQVLDELGNHFGGAAKFVALGLNLIVAGIFVLFGVFAHKRHLWAFITGMVLFALDALLMLLATDWIGLALHGFVLFCLFRGLQACRNLNTT